MSENRPESGGEGVVTGGGYGGGEKEEIFQKSYNGSQPKLGLWYPKDSPFDLEAYTDSDYAGASLDMKSTTGGCQFLGSRLISWQCKKQTIVANSTTEADMWLLLVVVDNTICIVKNPVFHSKVKHIEIRHHFIRDSNKKKIIQMIKIHTDQNVADLLKKHLMLADFNILLQVLECLTSDFWNTATAKTLDNGEIELTATIDGKVKIVTEASVSRHLQLADYDGISSLPTTEIFPRSPTQTPVADEAASTGVDVRYRGATTTVTGLEA
ncbi:hypothetical protein Tco_0972446 [Tanacetum coccineum]